MRNAKKTFLNGPLLQSISSHKAVKTYATGLNNYKFILQYPYYSHIVPVPLTRSDIDQKHLIFTLHSFCSTYFINIMAHSWILAKITIAMMTFARPSFVFKLFHKSREDSVVSIMTYEDRWPQKRYIHNYRSIRQPPVVINWDAFTLSV